MVQELVDAADAPRIDVALVTRLLQEQFPQWADLPVRSVEAQGCDNRAFRLGPGLSTIRRVAPSTSWAVSLIAGP